MKIKKIGDIKVLVIDRKPGDIPDLIAKAISTLKEQSDCDVCVMEELGGSGDFYISKNTTVEDALEQFIQQRKLVDETKKVVSEIEMEDPLASKDQFFSMLESITPVKIGEPMPTRQEYLDFCREVLIVFYKGRALDFNEKDEQRLIQIMREIGCRPYGSEETEYATLGQMVSAGYDTEYPSRVFEYIYTKKKDVSLGQKLSYFNDGLNMSWVRSELLHKISSKSFVQAVNNKSNPQFQ